MSGLVTEHSTQEINLKACPKCGSSDLISQPASGGGREIICLDLDCDFAQLVDSEDVTDYDESSFASRLSKTETRHLYQMADNLAESVENLKGRAKRLAKQQLALVNSELSKRSKSSSGAGKVPRQLNTSQAKKKRIQGIREYYQRRRKEQLSQAASEGCSEHSGLWLDILLKMLKSDISRHEAAAKNYGRVPELFPLHIEHTARAFELSRVVDMIEETFLRQKNVVERGK